MAAVFHKSFEDKLRFAGRKNISSLEWRRLRASSMHKREIQVYPRVSSRGIGKMRSDPQGTGHLRVPSSWNNPINSRPAEPTWPNVTRTKGTVSAAWPSSISTICRFLRFLTIRYGCVYIYIFACMCVCTLETRDRADPPIDRIKPNEQRPSSSVRTHRAVHTSLEYIMTQTVSKKKIRADRDKINSNRLNYPRHLSRKVSSPFIAINLI